MEAQDRRAAGAPVHEARPRHRIGKRPLNEPEAEVDRVSGAITALTDAWDGQCLDPPFDAYQTGLLTVGRTSRPPRIREVSQ
jgi:hypothetical protein